MIDYSKLEDNWKKTVGLKKVKTIKETNIKRI